MARLLHSVRVTLTFRMRAHVQVHAQWQKRHYLSFYPSLPWLYVGHQDVLLGAGRIYSWGYGYGIADSIVESSQNLRYIEF